MARIGILTCSNCTRDTNCASVSCLADMRKRQGLFERYGTGERLDLVGIISCAGCPTLAAPDKILRKVNALAVYHLDALHFTYCMTALCPFIKKYAQIIQEHHPGLPLVHGTHRPVDAPRFREKVRELLSPKVCVPQDMNDIIGKRLRTKSR